MEPLPIYDLSRLCIHTITTRPLNVFEAIKKYSEMGISGITLWRDSYSGHKLSEVRKQIEECGLTPVSVCRGGFFPSVSEAVRKDSVTVNIAAIHEAAELGAPMVVLVCGADPRQSLETSRDQIRQGIEAILPEAEKSGIKLAIEPLHPVYADTRSAINTMKQANNMADFFDSPLVGVAVDVYHVWWDPELQMEIGRCGERNRLFAFHICDWKSPTEDILNDRGIMGEGCIDIPRIRGWMESAGFDGHHEVEIFSDRYWKSDQDEYLKNIVSAYRHHV